MGPVIDIATRKPLVDGAVVVPDMVCGPKEVLEERLTNADSMEDVLVLFKNKDGAIGFTSTVEGVAENILFIERIKMQILFAQDQTEEGDTFA